MKKKIILFLLAICMIFCANVTVKAEEELYSIDVEVSYGTASNLTMTIVGDLPSDWNYYVKFVKNKEDIPTVPSNSSELETDYADINKWKTVTATTGNIYIAPDWYMLDGYEYAYLLAYNDQEGFSLLDTPIKVEKPELPDYGQRYQFYFFEPDETYPYGNVSIFQQFPGWNGGKTGSHAGTIKIGVINDSDLLYSIYKKETGSLEQLMDYAKKSSGEEFSFTSSEYSNIPFKSTIKDGAYYYIYTTFENSDGMYRDLSDINIAMGKNGVLTNDVTWNFNEEEIESSPVNTTTQKQESNPKTTDVNSNVVLIILAGSIALAVVAKKKIKKLSK